MDAYFLLFALAFLAFLAFSPAAAFELSPDEAAASFAMTFNTLVYEAGFPNFINLFGSHVQAPLAYIKNLLPMIFTFPFDYFKAVILSVAEIVHEIKQADTEPESRYTYQFIWVHLAVLSFLLCGVCIVLWLHRQAANKLVAACDELAHVVYNMPHSPFNINTSEIAEFKDRTDNTTLDDGDDSGAETSTVMSNEETDDWQAVAAKRSPHAINQNQEP